MEVLRADVDSMRLQLAIVFISRWTEIWEFPLAAEGTQMNRS